MKEMEATDKNQVQEFTEKAFWSLLPASSLREWALHRSGHWKSILQEYAVKHYCRKPVYRTEKSGKDHAPFFSTTVEVNGKFYKGTLSTKKREAEGRAARKAFIEIHDAEVAASMKEDNAEHNALSKEEITESPDRPSKKHRSSASKTLSKQ